MSSSTVKPGSAQPAIACPAWCHANHTVDRYAIDHTRMAGVVLREPHLESVAVEIEQLASGLPPRVVVSIFNQEADEAASADLTIDEARRTHAALGEALRLASDTPSTPTLTCTDAIAQSRHNGASV